MRILIEATADLAARAAADWLRDELEACVAQRGRCLLALSGGRSPWAMLDALVSEPLPWSALEVVQVDERVVPADDERRNARAQRAVLLRADRLAPARFHAMPVEAADLQSAAADYDSELERLGGLLPVLDVVQLGLGADGHTASLVPGDPVLELLDRDVAVTAGEYEGTRRMTLTRPMLDRARRVLWLVTGTTKAEAFARLVAGDRTIPGGLLASARAVAFVDEAAAAQMPATLRGWRA